MSSLPRHGGHVWSKSRPTWEKGACLENNQTWGQSEDEREGEKAVAFTKMINKDTQRQKGKECGRDKNKNITTWT